jgi:3-(3-hydroxy-phenyl)propionate hydroxylase
VLRDTLAQVALRRMDEHSKALTTIVGEILAMEAPRRKIAGEMSGLSLRYDLGEGHPLVGLRMPDLDLVTAAGPVRVYSLLHAAKAVLINFDARSRFDVAPWGERVRAVDASHAGAWELPAIGSVEAPRAVLIRPDGYVAWVGSVDEPGLEDALTKWLGPQAPM